MKKGIIFYPILFALFPVFFLYSHNIEEVSFKVIFIPLALSLSITFLIWLVLYFIIKNRQKSAMVTFLFVFIFFSYGHFFSILENINKKDDIPLLHLIIFWLILLSLISISILIIKTKKDLHNITTLLNIFVLALLLFSVFRIAKFHISSVSLPDSESEKLEDWNLKANLSLQKSKLPDIYYLVFDRYASSTTLKEYYNYDNSDFTNYLRDRGFYIASESSCNYAGTHLSLSSTLNMKYLNYLMKNAPLPKRVVYRMLQNFKVWRLLKSVGYQYIHFGSWWEPTRANKYADFNFKGGTLINISSEFLSRFLDTTVLKHVMSDNIIPIQHRERILRKFSELAEIPKMKGPKFVFTHWLIPHHPYIFGPDGEKVTTTEREKKSTEENYISQLIFTNKKIKWLVNELLTKSKRPPIIIIQSDEGPSEELSIKKFSDLDKGMIEKIKRRARLRIINAYYLPGVDKSILYKRISPVNTFRLIFNLYFGLKIELIEDKTYFVLEDKNFIRRMRLVPYEFLYQNNISLKK